MSRPPTDLDAILESIRQRIADPDAVPPVASPPPAPAPRAARLVEAPVIDKAGVTVEALFSAVLEPMLRQWLDANMPEICERVAQAEIQRLIGRG